MARINIKCFQIVDEDGSDSAIVDNALKFLSLAMEPEKAAMLLIPEPWLYNEANDANVRAFYEFYSYLMEPWDGPTMISFCNGDKLGALTDRNDYVQVVIRLLKITLLSFHLKWVLWTYLKVMLLLKVN
ncbi:hypothetical protein UM876_04450 [Staphylococcus aureus]|nr:hypothetical protein UM876_04450 [Staphylococcus aureus]